MALAGLGLAAGCEATTSEIPACGSGMSALGAQLAEAAHRATCSFESYLDHFVPMTRGPVPIRHDGGTWTALPEACVARFVEPAIANVDAQPRGVRLPPKDMRRYAASLRLPVSDQLVATVTTIFHPTAAYVALITYAHDGTVMDSLPIAGRRDLHVSLETHAWLAPTGELLTETGDGDDDARWFRIAGDGRIVAAEERQITSRELLAFSATRRDGGQ